MGICIIFSSVKPETESREDIGGGLIGWQEASFQDRVRRCDLMVLRRLGLIGVTARAWCVSGAVVVQV
jgi:hypothetical protein